MGTVNASTAGGTEAVAGALARGRSAIGPVSAFSVEGCPSRLAARIEDGSLTRLIGGDHARRLSRICQLTVGACELAVRDAGLAGGAGLGIVVGTEHGDFRSSEEFATGFLRRGPTGLSPLIFPNTVMNTMASVAAIAIGARAPSVTLNQPTVAGPARADRGSPVRRLLRPHGETRPHFRRCYGSGNGDPGIDDWERALLARDLDGRVEPGLIPPVSLAPLFGQHAGLGALRVGAAALDASRGMGPVLVHGIARGGCRTALVVAAPDQPRRS